MFKPATTYQAIFDQRADAYHKAMLDWPSARDQEFQAILSGLDIIPNMRILDVPSGGGYLANYLPNDTHIHHIETSELFAKLFEQHCHSGSRHPITLCRLDNLPDASNTIDLALSLAGLHHTEDKKPLFGELFRVLKAEGVLVLADAHKDSKTADFLDGWMGQHNSMGHHGWYFSSQDLIDLEQAGFIVTKAENRNYYWCFDSSQQAADYCKLMFGIDLASATEIENALDQLLGFETLANGKVGLHWQLHFITCVKPKA